MDRAASAWPRPTALMPERTVSPTNAPVYPPSTITAVVKPE